VALDRTGWKPAPEEEEREGGGGGGERWRRGEGRVERGEGPERGAVWWEAERTDRVQPESGLISSFNRI
jgi:hypothetical protein